MEEEQQKRNTDCVYFLASPLTCKKGIECEYRHNDIARLNPRDCWYWLAGSCLNPTCSFRHPPLESFTGTSYKSTTTYNQSVVPVNKTNAPCFFYYSGFCNKGEKCVFLHGPDDGAPTWQSSKISYSGVTDGPAPEKKASVGTEIESEPVEETHPSSFETGQKIASNRTIRTKDNLHQTTKNLTEGKTSPGISGSPSEEAAAIKLNSSLPAEGGCHLATEWSSDEMEDNAEREEWLESSPGFDVLVNDRSEELVGYEEDHEYSLQNDMDGRKLDEQMMVYDFEDNVEYDPVHLNTGIVFEEELHDSYNGFDNEVSGDFFRKINGHARERVMDSILPWKSKSRATEWGFSAKGNVDLREYLKKSRTVDADTLNYYPRRHESCYLSAPSENRPHLHSTRQMRRRLTSKVESNVSGSEAEQGSCLNGIKHQSTFRRSRMSSRYRQHFKRRRGEQKHFVSEEVSWRKRARESTDDCKLFSAPKTLSLIKEEKRRIGRRPSGPSVEDDFQGPKSLAEILKDKNK